ncbi:gamma subclass chorismate mutase AroQ [Pseudomonas sp. NFR16]|uniref:gamma subclass chorismate mutase AroQ n=1 Tax=Pseudomonas sp. NFR16 TaxID=1566248 RepID=UPI0008ADC59D|nr:gamma subclass chorismate mutase AroQ [Pseudomonas sp. NFR16]SEJ86578.1 chorismate mutase [Pseudomonas sp. NFR16]
MLREITLLLPAVLALTTPNASASEAPPSLEPLIKVIKERLDLAESVARYKLHHKMPVTDRGREETVIANARREAEPPLDREEIRELFVAQIEANKLAQYAWLARWQSLGVTPKAPGDISAVRSQLDQLQTRLLQTYADFAPHRRDPDCIRWVTRARDKQTLSPIQDMALIRAVGELCVVNK